MEDDLKKMEDDLKKPSYSTFYPLGTESEEQKRGRT